MYKRQALMLTVNTITDFFSVAADMDIRPDNDGYAKFRLKAPYVLSLIHI